ncbi:MAG TPA: hypothetical protein VGO59_04310 [Verrucomicrobiae bacterium]|jgi:hypothetical protein
MNKAPKPPPPRKSPVVPVLILAVLIIAGAVAFKAFHSSPATPPPAPAPAAEVEHPPAQTRPAAAASEAASVRPEAAAAPPPRRYVPPVAPAPQIARVDAIQLMSTLTNLAGAGPITPGQAEQWKAALQQLVSQGPSSVPAIQQFLAQNLDASYAGVSGANALGYNSIRSAMLDALAQIGGPESTQAMLQVLQSSIYPTDVPALAKALDGQSPGQYSQAILDAVRQQLNLGAMDQLGGANVLPLFQALASQAANGASVSADLAQYAEKWPYYSSIALAAMPDGAGVPTLIQITQGAIPGSPAAAAQALAELAPQNPQALSTLMDMAKGGQLSDSILSQMAPYLGGRELELGPPQNAAAGGYLTFHMANGNQDFSAFDGGSTLTPQQITQRISIIDQLLQNVPPTDGAAVDALNEQRAGLAARQK